MFMEKWHFHWDHVHVFLTKGWSFCHAKNIEFRKVPGRFHEGFRKSFRKVFVDSCIFVLLENSIVRVLVGPLWCPHKSGRLPEANPEAKVTKTAKVEPGTILCMCKGLALNSKKNIKSIQKSNNFQKTPTSRRFPEEKRKVSGSHSGRVLMSMVRYRSFFNTSNVSDWTYACLEGFDAREWAH